MKKTLLLLGLAGVLATVPAHAGNKFVDVEAGRLVLLPFYADKGEDLNFIINAKDASMLCGIDDKDKDVLVADKGQSCILFWTAPYTGKYFLAIKNTGRVVMHAVVSSLKDI